MGIETDKLISELTELTYKNIENAEALIQKPIDELNWRHEPSSWSALECIAHLNLYSNFYLPEIKYRINEQKTPSDSIFIPGFLGNYFANAIRPKEKLKKMKAPKDMNPIGSILSKETLRKFLLDQQAIILLLEDAKTVNLNQTKTAISISKLLKLKLGDTLRFVIYHNQRHMLQALRAIASQKAKAA